MKSSRKLLPAAAGLVFAALVAPAFADGGGNGGSGTCASLPGWSQLRQQLVAAIGPSNGGLEHDPKSLNQKEVFADWVL